MATGAKSRGEAAAGGRGRSLGRAGLIVALGSAVVAGCGATPKGSSITTAGTTTHGGANPTFAQTVELQPIRGTVFVKLPANSGLIPLTGARAVGLGAVIDVRAGVVRLTAAYPTPGHFAIADLQAGVFEVQQTRAGNGLTDLQVKDTQNERSACAVRGESGRGRTAHQLGLLLGSGKGQFRTDGRFSAATIRGTAWGVRDRCDGTLTIDRSGVVVVSDFRLHTTIVLGAGQSYLAKAP
jgi:hypothetical protein